MSTTKVALVTGGTGGIGAEICIRLARDGYRVVAADIGVSDEENGTTFRDDAPTITKHYIDICDEESIQKCVDYASKQGSLVALVNCAGLLRHGLIEDITEEGMHTVWNVNVAGMIRVCRAARPHMNAGSSHCEYFKRHGLRRSPERGRHLRIVKSGDGTLHALSCVRACAIWYSCKRTRARFYRCLSDECVNALHRFGRDRRRSNCLAHTAYPYGSNGGTH